MLLRFLILFVALDHSLLATDCDRDFRVLSSGISRTVERARENYSAHLNNIASDRNVFLGAVQGVVQKLKTHLRTQKPVASRPSIEEKQLNALNALHRELTELSGIKVNDPLFPKELAEVIQRIISTVREGNDEGLKAALQEDLRLLAEPLKDLLAEAQSSSVNTQLMQFAIPEWDSVADSQRLARYLGVSELRETGVGYDPRALKELYLAIGSLSKLLPRNREFESLAHQASQLMAPVENVSPQIQAKYSAHARAFTPPAPHSNIPLDAASFFTGKYFLSQALQGQKLAPKEGAIARAYLASVDQSKDRSALPRDFPANQASFLESLWLALGKYSPENRRDLDAWVRQLSSGSGGRELSPQDLIAASGLANRGPISQPQWERIAALTSGAAPLSEANRIFIQSMIDQIVRDESMGPYKSLGNHLIAMLERDFEKALPFQRELRQQHLRDLHPDRKRAAQPAASLRSNAPIKETEALVEYARGLETSGEFEEDRNLGSFYADRLLWLAQERGYKLTPEEKGRVEKLHRLIAQTRRTKPISEAVAASIDETYKNLSSVLSIYGGRPLDREIFEDALLFRASQGHTEVSIHALRTLLGGMHEPQKGDLNTVEFGDGWTNRGEAQKLEFWLDRHRSDPDYGAESLAWQRVGQMVPGESKNPALKDMARVFVWSGDFSSSQVFSKDGVGNIDSGDVRISYNTPKSGGPTSVEGFVRVPRRGGKEGELIWLPFAGVETPSGWKLVERIDQVNSHGKPRSEAVITNCAKCHMTPSGQFSPTPDPKRFQAPESLRGLATASDLGLWKH